jgi:hypothetical protein
MPLYVDITGPNGDTVRVTHASMVNNRNGVFPRTTDDDLRHKIQTPNHPPPAVLCVGHTHWPLIRSIDDTLVVNVGSVGLPFDGDHRAAYGQLTRHCGQWHAEIIRLDYDRQQAEQDFYDSGYLEGGGVLTRLIIDEFHIARPHLFRWMHEYYPLTVNGDLSVEEAVINYLSERNRL